MAFPEGQDGKSNEDSDEDEPKGSVLNMSKLTPASSPNAIRLLRCNNNNNKEEEKVEEEEDELKLQIMSMKEDIQNLAESELMQYDSSSEEDADVEINEEIKIDKQNVSLGIAKPQN